MANSLVIFLKTPTTVKDKNPNSAAINTREKWVEGRALINELRGLLGGDRRGNLSVGTASPGAADAVSASFTLTLSGALTAADTVTINGQALTVVASAPTANQFIGAVSAAADAASLAACINNFASTAQKVVGIVNATATAAGVVTVTCNIPGVVGNLVTCTKSASAITLAGLTSNSPTNGAGGLPVLKSFSYGY